MNSIVIDGVTFEKTEEIYPIKDGLFYKGDWYKASSVGVDKNVEFISDDGTAIWNGDEVWWVATNKMPIVGLCNTFPQYGQYDWKKDGWRSTGKNYKWFSTEGEVKKYIASRTPNYEILEFKDDHNTYFRVPNGKFTINLQFFYNETDLINVGNVITMVRCISTGEVYSLGDQVKPVNVKGVDDKGYKSITGFEIKDNVCYVLMGSAYANREITGIVKAGLTFGGEAVNFVFMRGLPAEKTIVSVDCKGVVGTDKQIKDILDNFWKPCKFGTENVKSFSWNADCKGPITLSVVYHKDARDLVDEITIGCLTGKYSELVDIYAHCLTLY